MGRNIQAGGLVIDSTNPSEIGRYMKDISKEKEERDRAFIGKNGTQCIGINLRHQGKSIGVTIPVDVIRELGLVAGDKVDIIVSKSVPPEEDDDE